MPARFQTQVATVVLVIGAASAAAQQSVSPRDTAHNLSFMVEAEHAWFNNISPWKAASASIAARSTAGSIIGRVNYADRFSTHGVQYEADGYPTLGAKGRYAYLNVGYSPDPIFPRWRSGAELYTNLPNAYEASLGYRQLRFDGTEPLTLFTGTVGKYTGNYWFSLRPFIRQRSGGPSASASLTARRYFEGASHYIGARIGTGTTPSDRLTTTELARTSSTLADVHGLNPIALRTLLSWTVAWERERLTAANTRQRLVLTAGLRVDF